MKHLALVGALVCAFALLLIPVASASSASALHQQRSIALRVLHRDMQTLRFFRNHPALAVRPVGRTAERHAWRQHLDALRWLAHIRAALAPRPAIVAANDLDAWLCIHNGEGSWNDTRNPIYDGGLQEDQTFQQEYGPEFFAQWGRAYNWPAWAQITAARRARDGWTNPVTGATYAARGYYPWPNTARACGLI